jgi:predicted transcriptional regulator YdeE
MTSIKDLKIIGISVRTTNQNNQSAQDIGNLWRQFYADKLVDKIPNKSSNAVYSIYTDYQSDFTGEYTTIIGLKVDSLDTIPAGLIGRHFPADNFVQFIAKGQMPNAVLNTWANIWKQDKELNRKYAYDFEVYGDTSQRGENSEVEIYIATKS